MIKDPGLRKVAMSLYEHLNTPRSLSCFLLLKYGSSPLDGDQLVTLTTDPRNYMDTTVGAELFRRDTQATDFLRKSPLVITSFDLKKRALDVFHECEAQCKVTNEFLGLLQLRTQASNIPVCDEIRRILDGARKIAGRILGSIPDDLPGRFGPGTSAELKGSTYATVADKLLTKPFVTPDCQALFEHEFWRTHWGRSRLVAGLPLPGTIRGNRFTTVPKDSKSLRGICVEPLGNLWVQLGIGGYLKRRLAGVGLKVGRSSVPQDPIQRLSAAPSSDGQSFHRNLAREGSVRGEWCTIDLSNASDTVATELVRWVLPPDWFELLYACRSPKTFINGSWVHLEKFSSMGNGFTFELESLIFAAILAAGLGLKVGRDCFVYGDDIVIPGTSGRDAMAILRAVGFTPNGKKSFIDGPFRESCGGDYFLGTDVRSVYAKASFESPVEWVALHNLIRRKWPQFGAVLHRIVERLPTRLRVFGPEFLGDSVLHADTYRTITRKGDRYKWQRYVAAIVVDPVKVPLDRWSPEMVITTILCGARSNRGVGFLTPRGGPAGYRIRLASVS